MRRYPWEPLWKTEARAYKKALRGIRREVR